ncbi:MAG: HoxN/HupN/NixA family nickel/cobalt transporter [Methylobacteriaceae bacterium]|nr:HoxN/HupN/NixA family nickel/cobalt transporter [Methylobacteriaceae bacterium]
MQDTQHVARRAAWLMALLVSANLAAWLWAYGLFSLEATLLSTALLAYLLGLRHAVDPDHIAAIDNVTRKLMEDGQRPTTVGFWFALGHVTTVVAASGAVALAVTSVSASDELKELGGLLGTGISAGFLLVIGIVNLVVLVGIWRSFRQVRRTGRYVEADLDMLLAGRGFLARLLRPLFRLVTKPWHMLPLGFLFALGFDTATEISLFGLAAAEASKGASFWAVMVFPVLFAAGMALVDTADGILMLGAYGWASVRPARKLVYNLAITTASVLIALGIGLVEALNLLATKLSLEGAIWSWAASANDHLGVMGFAAIGLFAAAWLASWLADRAGLADAAPATLEPR